MLLVPTIRAGRPSAENAKVRRERNKTTIFNFCKNKIIREVASSAWLGVLRTLAERARIAKKEGELSNQ